MVCSAWPASVGISDLTSSNNCRSAAVTERAVLAIADVAFHDFESWAKAQDWNTLL